MSNTKKPADRAKQGRKKYRLNKKKLAGAVTVLVLAAVLVCAAAVILTKKLAGTEMVMHEAEENIMVSSSEQNDQLANEQNDEPADVQMGELKDKKPLDGYTIVVDAGHGGFDPGAIGAGGTHEDVLNLDIANCLNAELESRGAKVVMTREDENALAENKEGDMAQRGIVIRRAEADIVVSIHMNFYDEDPDICGPLVLFMPGSQMGKELAESIQNSMNKALGSDNSARSESLAILKSGSQPSVLVECGFLSNAQEEEKLGEAEYQSKTAVAVCEGIMEFFKEEMDSEDYEDIA